MPEKVTTWEHYCISNAIRDAWTYEIKTGRYSRIAEYQTDTPGRNHSQAQGWTGDKWIWLTTHNSDGILREWVRHYDQGDEPVYYRLDDFIAKHARIRRNDMYNPTKNWR